MPELVPPDVRYQKSFLEAAEEVLWSTDDNHYAGLAVFPPVDDYPGEDYDLEELRSTETFAVFASLSIHGLKTPG